MGELWNSLEEWLVALAHTHHCTAWYCQKPDRVFIPGDRCADVIYKWHPFGTMHEDCARVFRLHWFCRAQAHLN